jgi:hypothetical protein
VFGAYRLNAAFLNSGDCSQVSKAKSGVEKEKAPVKTKVGIENEMVITKGKAGGENEKVASKPTKAVSRAPLQPRSEFDSDANIAQAKNNDKTIEETYQKKTQLEHILLRPDTYVGSIEKHTQALWVYENDNMVYRNVTFVPGLYKIFDEILVNAADNKQRDPSMDCVKVLPQPVSLVLGCGGSLPVTFVVLLSIFLKHVIRGLCCCTICQELRKPKGTYTSL